MSRSYVRRTKLFSLLVQFFLSILIHCPWRRRVSFLFGTVTPIYTNVVFITKLTKNLRETQLTDLSLLLFPFSHFRRHKGGIPTTLFNSVWLVFSLSFSKIPFGFRNGRDLFTFVVFSSTFIDTKSETAVVSSHRRGTSYTKKKKIKEFESSVTWWDGPQYTLPSRIWCKQYTSLKSVSIWSHLWVPYNLHFRRYSSQPHIRKEIFLYSYPISEGLWHGRQREETYIPSLFFLEGRVRSPRYNVLPK